MGDCPIYVSIYLSGVRFCSSVGHSVAWDKWDSGTQRVKHGAFNARKIPYNKINSRLAAITSTFDDLESNKAKLTKDQIKRKLAAVIGRSVPGEEEETGQVKFLKHYAEFVLDGKLNLRWAENTIKKWVR